jgi:hypothetical protein
MERWEIRPAPNADDPQRCLLLMRGGPADVAAVLKKFGALCGRPTPIDGEEFNLSFALHRVTPEARRRLDKWFGQAVPMTPRATEIPLAPPPAPPAVSPVAAPRPADTRVVSATVADELRAEWTFETLLVGAYNRFAHAAAMSVVTSPGSMYNPLFLYGVPGTGKSHMLHAIANSMSKGLGTASLLVTSGARLSHAVSMAAARGSMAEIDKKVTESKAIFVDDIHLLAVTDVNADLLAKLFKSFFDRRQQVVVSSMYPPKALGTLEEALKFTFAKGWSVDLKIPSPSVQRDHIAAVSERIGAQLSGDEVGLLAGKLTVWGYQDLSLWVKRIAVLRRMRPSLPLLDALRLIYEPIQTSVEAAPASTSGSLFAPPAAPDEAETLAIIVPKGQEGLGAYVANLFQETGAKNGFARAYRYAPIGTYDAMQQVGAPFLIADMCHRAEVTRALVVGPGADSPLAARVNEFGHAVRRILGSSGVVAGWIPHAQAHLVAHYVNAHLDFDR